MDARLMNPHSVKELVTYIEHECESSTPDRQRVAEAYACLSELSPGMCEVIRYRWATFFLDMSIGMS